MQERRSAPRIPLADGLSIKIEDLWVLTDERSSNISTTGMFISTDDPFEPGTVFSFSVDLGRRQQPIAGEAEVVWSRAPDEGSEEPAGMGVKFLEIDGDGLTTIIVLGRSS